MNITITGNLGSGKSSVCAELKKAGFTVIAAGDIFREIAMEKHMTVIELNEAAKSDRSIDDMLDQRSTELGRSMDHTVFDSRLAWYFVEHSFKVFLLVDTGEAARRVSLGNQRNAEIYQSREDAAAGLKARAELERERFFELYGIDYYDGSNYDLIIESSCATPQQIAREIIRNFELYQKQPYGTKVELNLPCIYPSKKSGEMDMRKLEQYRLEEENSPSLCALATPQIRMYQGYNYLVNGHHRVFAAAAAGKIFVEIRGILPPDAQQPVRLSAEDLAAFEKALGFTYREDPAQLPEKNGYMLDFTRISQ